MITTLNTVHCTVRMWIEVHEKESGTEKEPERNNDEEDKNSFSFVSVNEKESFQLQMNVVIYFSTFPLSVSHLRSLLQFEWESFSSYICGHMLSIPVSSISFATATATMIRWTVSIFIRL